MPTEDHPSEGHPSDDELVELIRSGSDEGVRLLLDVHGPSVKGRLMKRFRRNHELDIEHSINDAACEIWLAIEEGRFDRSRGRLRSWLFVIARNNMVGRLRAAQAASILSAIGLPDLPAELQARDDHSTRSARIQRLLDSLQTCIARLSPMRQDIILSGLLEYDSVDDKEIANRWNTTTNTIRTARHKARKRLARLLRKETE